VGLIRLDGKMPDGLTLRPWQGGKPLTWEIAMVSTLTDSYFVVSARSVGDAADLAGSRKWAK